jgi:hypothetical protein
MMTNFDVAILQLPKLFFNFLVFSLKGRGGDEGTTCPKGIGNKQPSCLFHMQMTTQIMANYEEANDLGSRYYYSYKGWGLARKE